MEEILNKINEMEHFEDRKNELDDKQADIKGKKEELKKLQEKRSMNISPITRPVLDEQIEDLESYVEDLYVSFTKNYSEGVDLSGAISSQLNNLSMLNRASLF